MRSAALHFYARLQRVPGLGARAPANRLRPELGEVIPANPVFGPLTFGVRRPGYDPPKAVLPLSKHRVARVGHEDNLSAGLWRRADVALQLGQAAHAI